MVPVSPFGRIVWTPVGEAITLENVGEPHVQLVLHEHEISCPLQVLGGATVATGGGTIVGGTGAAVATGGGTGATVATGGGTGATVVSGNL